MQGQRGAPNTQQLWFKGDCFQSDFSGELQNEMSTGGEESGPGRGPGSIRGAEVREVQGAGRSEKLETSQGPEVLALQFEGNGEGRKAGVL